MLIGQMQVDLALQDAIQKTHKTLWNSVTLYSAKNALGIFYNNLIQSLSIKTDLPKKLLNTFIGTDNIVVSSINPEDVSKVKFIASTKENYHLPRIETIKLVKMLNHEREDNESLIISVSSNDIKQYESEPNEDTDDFSELRSIINKLQNLTV